VLDAPNQIFKESMVDAQIVDEGEASSEYGKRSPTPKSLLKPRGP
jgi:hypothetical protein